MVLVNNVKYDNNIDFTTREINNIALKAVLCYDNWI